MARKKQTALASAIANANKTFAFGGPQPRVIRTHSPLDALLGGGFVEGSTTLVVGEAAQGKTALLQYLQGQLERAKPFKFGRSAYIGHGSSQAHTRFGWAIEFDELIDLVERCKEGSKPEHPVFFIDDVTVYAVANAVGAGLGAAGAMWSNLLLKTWREDTLVLGVQARRNVPTKTPQPSGSKALAFSANTILNVSIQATIPNGVVLKVDVTKSRTSPAGGSCLLSIVMDETGLWTEEIQ